MARYRKTKQPGQGRPATRGGALRALFISYDGLAEPLGRSQVLPYMQGLAARGARCAILSFEKPKDLKDSARHKALKEEVEGMGIVWSPLLYHKRPTLPATLYDVARGVAEGTILCRRLGLRAVHARGYVSALIGLALKRMLGLRFIFDMRNFWADEKVDAGAWPARGALYRAAKRAERALLSDADHVVVLTERAKEELLSFPYLAKNPPTVSVIPTCVDLGLFRPRPGKPREGPPVLAYAGSLGGRYLTDLLFSFAAEVRRQQNGTRLLVLTRAEEAVVTQAASRAALPKEALRAFFASRQRVAEELAACHAGLSFLSDAYSNRSSAPTKLAEYLAAGLPLVVTPGVGDTDSIIEEERVGVIVRGDDLPGAAADLLALLKDPALSGRCRRAAEKHFALPDALDRYEAIWRAVA